MKVGGLLQDLRVLANLRFEMRLRLVSSYVIVNTPTDAEFLSDHSVVENCLGTEEEVAQFFSYISKDAAFDRYLQATATISLMCKNVKASKVVA